MKTVGNDDVQGGTAAALPTTTRRNTRPALLLAAGFLCAVLVQGAWAQSPHGTALGWYPPLELGT